MKSSRRYRSFVLRCWQNDPPGGENRPMWRFSLESTDGSETRRGFHDLPDLLAFLGEHLEQGAVIGRESADSDPHPS